MRPKTFHVALVLSHRRSSSPARRPTLRLPLQRAYLIVPTQEVYLLLISKILIRRIMGSILSNLCASLPSTLWVRVTELMAGFGPTVFSKLSDESRVRMIDALRHLIHYNQTGFDVGWQYTVSSPSIRAAIATLALANVFRPWAAAGWGGKTAEELTEMSGSGAELELISWFAPFPHLCPYSTLSVSPLLGLCLSLSLSLSHC